MITQDKYQAILELARMGMAKKAIARLLEMDIKTVRKHLKKMHWQSYQRSVIKKRLLDDYIGWIKMRLLEVNYNASVIFQELKLMGYTICCSFTSSLSSGK
jgi:transposase